VKQNISLTHKYGKPFPVLKDIPALLRKKWPDPVPIVKNPLWGSVADTIKLFIQKQEFDAPTRKYWERLLKTKVSFVFVSVICNKFFKYFLSSFRILQKS
jgi:hypothetical protein